MTSTNKTEHYELSQYTDGDRPTYIGDYNSDMSKIDAAIYAASQSGGGGMATVAHTADLTGDGTTDNPLGVADTIARAGDIPSLDGYATTESVTQAIAAAIADRLTAGDIKPGNGINVETSGNQVTISYVGGGSAGGLAAVAHDATLKGDGTTATPLAIAANQVFATADGTIKDANDMTAPGCYISDVDTVNVPGGEDARGQIIVPRNLKSRTIPQVMFSSFDKATGIFFRVFQGEAWSEWKQVAYEDDISALTSRIATLEQQVAALTAAAAPSATGLTAEQLDSQYSDGYNIVRVGTPTQLNESEVTPNE